MPEWNKSIDRHVDLGQGDNHLANNGTKNGELEIGTLLQEDRWTS